VAHSEDRATGCQKLIWTSRVENSIGPDEAERPTKKDKGGVLIFMSKMAN
jgi:hypothetical protein